MLQIAVVGQTWLWIKNQTNFDICVLHLQRSRESGKSPEGALGQRVRAFINREPEQRLPQLWREQGRQGPAFWCLQAQSVYSGAFSVVSHSIEQDGLSDAAETDH
jgi:hypothetical protein